MSKVHIPALYNKVRDRVMKVLGSAHMDYYSSTTDMWPSHGMMPYMGFTTHYIDEEWNLQTQTLRTKSAKQSHWWCHWIRDDQHLRGAVLDPGGGGLYLLVQKTLRGRTANKGIWMTPYKKQNLVYEYGDFSNFFPNLSQNWLKF